MTSTRSRKNTNKIEFNGLKQRWTVRRMTPQYGFIGGIAIDKDENVYASVHSEKIYNVIKIEEEEDEDGKRQIQVCGGSGSGFKDGPSSYSLFDRPYGIALDSKGNIYIADNGNRRIRKIERKTNTVSTIAGNGHKDHKDGSIQNALFKGLHGLAMDASENLYVTDDYRIRKINLKRGTVETIAGNGLYGYRDGRPKDAMFKSPYGIVADYGRSLYVTDCHNHCIRKITKNAVITICGTGQKGGKDGPFQEALFDEPLGITLDNEGNILVTDNNGIRVIDIQNESVTTLVMHASLGLERFGQLKFHDRKIYIEENSRILCLTGHKPGEPLIDDDDESSSGSDSDSESESESEESSSSEEESSSSSEDEREKRRRARTKTKASQPPVTPPVNPPSSTSSQVDQLIEELKIVDIDQPSTESNENDSSHGKVAKKVEAIAEVDPSWHFDISEINLGEKLGETPQAKVFKATWKDKTIAVKQIPQRKRQELFFNLDVIKKLKHPNLVAIFGECIQEPWILMEYIPKGTLRNWLADDHHKEADDIKLKIVKGIVAGMTCLHSKALIHRNLVAHNILLDSELNPKLTDFAMTITVPLRRTTQSKSTYGRPEATAPEIVLQQEFDQKTDVWSFGVVLYEILTHKIPYKGLNPFQIFQSLQKQEPYLKLDVLQNVELYPKPLVDVLETCLSFTPSERPDFEAISISLESSFQNNNNNNQ